MSQKGVTLELSPATSERLEQAARGLGTHSPEQTIEALIREHRNQLIHAMAGSLKGRLGPFTEADRIDSDWDHDAEDR
jgi:hypothetical protein